MSTESYPSSPRVELDGLPYFPRLCEKARLHGAGELHRELIDNLGKGMDLWMCQFLGVEYEALKAEILNGASNEQALQFAKENGVSRPDYERDWFLAYLQKRGFRDNLSEKLQMRVAELETEAKDGIKTFFDYIDVDEGRTLD